MARKKIGEAPSHDIEVDGLDAIERVRQIQAQQEKVDRLREEIQSLSRRLNAAKGELKQALWDRDHFMRLGLRRFARPHQDANGEGGGG